MGRTQWRAALWLALLRARGDAHVLLPACGGAHALSWAAPLPHHYHHHCRVHCVGIARTEAVTMKLLSRSKVDFASTEPRHEFGLQGDIIGLAPTADSGVLLFVAALVFRSHRLPVPDVAFALAFPAYLVLANTLRFDRTAARRFKPLLREGRGAWLKRYMLAYALAGLVLPLPLVFAAPSAVALAAAPHLFLYAVQCAVEGLTTHTKFAAVLRLVAPIGFGTYRLGALHAWCTSALATAAAVGSSAAAVSAPWAFGALALAAANAVMAAYHLLVFLPLRAAPQYFNPAEFPAPPVRWRWSLLPVVEWSADEARADEGEYDGLGMDE